MTTTLTTPIQRTVTIETVDGWGLRASRNSNLTVNLEDSRFDMQIVERLADGTPLTERVAPFVLANLSPAALATLRGIHNQFVAFARSQGALRPGVDAADI